MFIHNEPGIFRYESVHGGFEFFLLQSPAVEKKFTFISVCVWLVRTFTGILSHIIVLAIHYRWLWASNCVLAVSNRNNINTVLPRVYIRARKYTQSLARNRITTRARKGWGANGAISVYSKGVQNLKRVNVLGTTKKS